MKSWERFVRDHMGMDPIITMALSYEATEKLIIQYISFEILRGMNPNSIKKEYLGAIGSCFLQMRVINHFHAASTSLYVRFVLRGYLKIHAIAHPLHGQKKLAFTIELTTYVEAAMDQFRLHMHDELKREAIMLAMVLGIYFMLRKSEFLPMDAKNKGRQCVETYRILFGERYGDTMAIRRTTGLSCSGDADQCRQI
jgi:hypothetical protein